MNIPLGPSVRDPSLEADLQNRLEQGHRIFVVGDVHGHLATFRALLHRLQLKPEDRVICLGDMIDRGPNSAGVVNLLRSHPQLICIKGNHEQMAIQSVQSNGTFQAWRPWMKRGGKSTYGSYIVQAEGDLWKAKRTMLQDFMWLDTCPTQIVLDSVRLVHAGYDPRMPLDMQGEKELLWIRKEWYLHDAPVDRARTVFFGHTTTTKLDDQAGDVALSSVVLPDGRPAWVGVDVGAYNHVSPGLAAVEITTLRVTKQITLKCDRWFDGFQRKKTKGKRLKPWKSATNKKEAGVAESFGLKALAHRARLGRTTALRVQRQLEKAGVVFPNQRQSHSTQQGDEALSDHHKSGHRIVYRTGRAQQGSLNSRGPTSFRIHRRQGMTQHRSDKRSTLNIKAKA